MNFDMNDKNLVIICATIICLVSIGWIANPENIVLNIVTGMFGVAVGQATKA